MQTAINKAREYEEVLRNVRLFLNEEDQLDIDKLLQINFANITLFEKLKAMPVPELDSVICGLNQQYPDEPMLFMFNLHRTVLQSIQDGEIYSILYPNFHGKEMVGNVCVLSALAWWVGVIIALAFFNLQITLLVLAATVSVSVLGVSGEMYISPSMPPQYVGVTRGILLFLLTTLIVGFPVTTALSAGLMRAVLLPALNDFLMFAVLGAGAYLVLYCWEASDRSKANRISLCVEQLKMYTEDLLSNSIYYAVPKNNTQPDSLANRFSVYAGKSPFFKKIQQAQVDNQTQIESEYVVPYY